MKKTKQLAITTAALLLLFLLLTGQLIKPVQVLASDESGTEHFQITMLDVKQGLCILVESNGHYMLYDGGGKKRSSYVVSYLKKHKITNLDYIVASHYDEDHVSGLSGVMNALTVQTAITPDYVADSACYHSFRKNLEKNNISEVHPEAGEVYPFGHAKIRILASNPEADPENNRSIIVRISCKDYSCLITGDAEAQAERDLLSSSQELASDLFVAGHHGSASSNTEALIQAVNPTAAFISVGKDNTYGHPAPETLQLLREQNCAVYRTDKQKEVSVSYDGKQAVYSQEPWVPVKKEADNAASSEAPSGSTELLDPFATDTAGSEDSAISADRSLPADSQVMDYTLNVNTGKFHYPECKSAKQTKDKNKREVTCTRDELIAQGYKPCQNCNP